MRLAIHRRKIENLRSYIRRHCRLIFFVPMAAEAALRGASFRFKTGVSDPTANVIRWCEAVHIFL
jgi:hypothetical protein